MILSKSFNIYCHQILSTNLHRSGKVIHLLKLIHILINLTFHTSRRPHYSPFIFLLFRNFFESIIFKCVLHNYKFWVVKFVVISSVRWNIRLTGQRVYIWSEYQVFSPYSLIDFSIYSDLSSFFRIKYVDFYIF